MSRAVPNVPSDIIPYLLSWLWGSPRRLLRRMTNGIIAIVARIIKPRR